VVLPGIQMRQVIHLVPPHGCAIEAFNERILVYLGEAYARSDQRHLERVFRFQIDAVVIGELAEETGMAAEYVRAEGEHQRIAVFIGKFGASQPAAGGPVSQDQDFRFDRFIFKISGDAQRPESTIARLLQCSVPAGDMADKILRADGPVVLRPLSSQCRIQCGFTLHGVGKASAAGIDALAQVGGHFTAQNPRAEGIGK